MGTILLSDRYAVENGRRTFRDRVQHTRAHRRYLAVDPHDVANKLEQHGLQTEVGYIGRSHLRSYVNARWMPDDERVEYKDAVSFLLDHTGRGAVKVQPGTVRIACANQFYLAPFSFHHCEEPIRFLAEHPMQIAERVRQLSREMPDLIEKFALAPAQGFTLANEFRKLKPRLGNRVSHECQRFHVQEPVKSSTWAFIQALGSVARPGTAKLLTYCLTEGRQSLMEGRASIDEGTLKWRPSLELFDLN